MSSYAAQGQVAADIAVRILKGTKPEEIPVVRGTNLYMFDARALRRWGLNENMLPPGAPCSTANRHSPSATKARLLVHSLSSLHSSS